MSEHVTGLFSCVRESIDNSRIVVDVSRGLYLRAMFSTIVRTFSCDVGSSR